MYTWIHNDFAGQNPGSKLELKKKIVIAEDQTIVRKGLRSLLESEENIEVVAEAGDGIETIKCVEQHQPDLLLLDLAMPKMSGLSALKDIKERFKNTRILVLTFHASEEYILEAFGSGADGYCLKNDTHTELLTAIRNLLAGKSYISPFMLNFLISRVTCSADSSE